MSDLKEISVFDLKELKANNEDFTLIDVREKHEKEISDIGGVLMPLSKFEVEINKINHLKDEKLIVYCRSGGRSRQASMFLLAKGFSNVTNLEGGINAWASHIDKSVQQY